MQIAGIDKLVRVRFKRFDPGYFRTLGIPVLSGREISSGDRDGTPRVIVINEALVTRLKDIGGRIRLARSFVSHIPATKRADIDTEPREQTQRQT